MQQCRGNSDAAARRIAEHAPTIYSVLLPLGLAALVGVDQFMDHALLSIDNATPSE